MAIECLDEEWFKFRHEREVPGPTERAEAGSTLDWSDTSLWGRPAVAARRPAGAEVPRISKTTQWLVDSGCGYDLVDAQKLQYLRDSIGPRIINPLSGPQTALQHVRDDVPQRVARLNEACPPPHM